MLASSVPAKFNIPFANSATPGINVRPIPTNPPAQAGAASLSLGFPPLNFTPVAAGGIPPFGQDMNGVLQQVTSWLRWQAGGGPIVYDAAFATSIGGYPRGAMIQSTSGHVVYENLADNNTVNPNGGGANWRVAFSPWSSRAWGAVGSANAQVLTLTPAPSVLGELINIPITFFSQGTNTGPVTLNVNGLGNIQILQASGPPLGINALVVGSCCTVVYNGANFLLTSQISTFTDVGTGGATVSGVNNANGANVALFGNGGTTPNKFIRAANGVLQILNNAYSAVLATISDAGAMSVASTFTSGGAITAQTGNITSQAGRLRAALGAFQSGDNNAATILGDYFSAFTIPGACVFPNGLVLQWGGNTVPANTTLNVNYSLVFPTQRLVGASLIGGVSGVAVFPPTLNIRGVPTTNGFLQIINPNASSIQVDWIVVGN